MRKPAKCIWILAFSLLVCQWSYGTGVRNLFVSQKSAGMGGAGTALALDGSAMHYNPGALAFTKAGLTMGFNPLFMRTSFQEEKSLETFNQRMDVAVPLHFFASLGDPTQPWRAGLGIYTAYDITSNWGGGWPGEFIVKNYQMQATNIAASFSYNLFNKFGIGVSAYYTIATLSFIKSLNINGINSDFAEMNIVDQLNGFGLNIGALYNINNQLHIGLTYRTAVKYASNNGSVSFDVPESQESDYPETAVSSKFVMPHQLSVGFMYKANSKFTVSLEATYVTWSQFDSLSFDFQENTESLQDIREYRKKSDSWSFVLGSQYEVSRLFSFQVGFFFEPKFVDEGYMLPELPNADRFGVTGGLSFNVAEKLDLNFSMAYITESERRELALENIIEFGGRYKTAAISTGIGITYLF